MLGQADLARTLFPVGELGDKGEVRAMAAALGLRTAAKPDSQDVCFITSTGGGPSFLRRRHRRPPGAGRRPSGARVGEVDAVELVTLGQRKGLGLPGGGPKRYVVDVDRGVGHRRRRRRAPSCCDDRCPSTASRGSTASAAGDVVVQCSAHGAARRRRSPSTAAASTSRGTSRSAEWRRARASSSTTSPTTYVLGGGIAAD